MGSNDLFGLASLLGLLGTVALSIYRWEQGAYRFTPFVYATIIAAIWSWTWEKSLIESLSIVGAMNLVAGGMLLAAWFQIRQK